VQNVPLLEIPIYETNRGYVWVIDDLQYWLESSEKDLGTPVGVLKGLEIKFTIGKKLTDEPNAVIIDEGNDVFDTTSATLLAGSRDSNFKKSFKDKTGKDYELICRPAQ
jgi:hypothetical protein